MRVTGGRRIRAIYSPPGRAVPLRGSHHKPAAEKQPAGPAVADALVATINSPSIEGFVPWVATVATNKKDADEYTASAWEGVVGQPFVADPSASYCIGLYDTGATASVIGYESANLIGLYAGNQLTLNTVTVTGVTGSVDCHTSKPLGLFIDGLQAIDPQSLLLDINSMAGESNVSVLVAPEPAPGAPDLFTAIGAPMAAYFNATFRNDQPVTRVIGGQTYTAPTIRLYEDAADPRIPAYANKLLLSYLPGGDTTVAYFPCFSILFGCPDDEKPMYPSLIGAMSGAQSLFFLNQSNGLDVSDGAYSRTFYKFIIDTGSQLTVIGSTVVSRLHLPTASPDFQVEVQGLDGQIVYKPGFYLDTLDIPTISPTGEWLTFTQVPVVYLDVASPECTGCVLDGIIGMNLLEKYNFVVHGGVLDGVPPSITYERAPVFGDANGDFDVDHDDFLAFRACFSGPRVLAVGQSCPAFDADGDGDVDAADFGAFQACYSGTDVAGDPWCRLVP